MHTLSRSVLALAVALSLAPLAFAQNRATQGLGGVLGGQQNADPLAILRNPTFKKELALTDEQLKKLPEAVQKALTEVLDAKQLKRLKQIELQQKGAQAFLDPTVQSELNLTEAQKESIKKITDAAPEALKQNLQELVQGLRGGGGLQGIQGKLGGLQGDVMNKCLTVLTDSQKKQWTEMIGEPISGAGRRLGGKQVNSTDGELPPQPAGRKDSE